MKLASFEALVKALHGAGVRYLVAGGLAVNAHGYLRMTQDVDLVVQLDPRNVIAAFEALALLGYKPAVPVKAEQFADASQRALWIRDKGMTVLNFFSDLHRETSVDMFVSEPFDFDGEYRAATTGEIAPGVAARFVSIPALIRMKTIAGRPHDLVDVEHLGWILDEQKRKHPGT